MSRRGYDIRLVCGHEGCRESNYTVADTRKEEREARQRYAERPWRCYRHSSPDDVLAPDSPFREGILINEEKTYGQFWVTEIGRSGSGLTSGPGFKAIAGDFPPGTKLIVTARIELPASGVVL